MQSLDPYTVLRLRLPFSGCKHRRPMTTLVHFASRPTPNTMPRTGIPRFRDGKTLGSSPRLLFALIMI